MIRALEPQDHDEWLRLWRGYLDFYGTNLSDEQSELTWARLLDKGEPAQAFVAEVEGKVCGLAHVLPHRSTWAKNGYLYLEDLFVAPEMRGRNLGKALIEHVYGFADQHAYERVYWATQAGNPARALYDQLAQESGFVQYRR